MKIGIIGTGNMGSALGRLWAVQGHEIFFGSRNPDKARTVAQSVGAGATSGNYEEAAWFGEVVVLAVPWHATMDSIKSAGNLDGKVLVDCTNPVAPGMEGLEVGLTTSAGEMVQEWARGACVVKAFNTLGVQNLSELRFGMEQANTFICGDDDGAKSMVRELAEEIGFDVIDVGPLSSARLLEPLAMLWLQLAYKQGMGPDIAFKLLRR